MNGFWYSVEPEDVLSADVLSASDDVCHFRVQKAREDSCVKLTKGMRFIWMVTPELAAENPKVGKRPLRWPFLECKRIVYARKKWWRFWEKKKPLLYEFEVVEEMSRASSDADDDKIYAVVPKGVKPVKMGFNDGAYPAGAYTQDVPQDRKREEKV